MNHHPRHAAPAVLAGAARPVRRRLRRARSPLPTLPVEPADGVDADAGSWRMIVLARPDDIAVPPPADVDARRSTAPSWPRSRPRSGSSPTRSARRSRTGARAACCAGTRSCASWWPATTCRRRRAPTARTRCPDAANPFADPQFPFANPPYAARAYSYVSVAQYDALKAAWYYKYQYRRPAPSQVDTHRQRARPRGRPARVSVRGRRALRRQPRSCCARCSRPPSRRSTPRPPSSATPRSGRAAPPPATSPPAWPSAAPSRRWPWRARARTGCAPRSGPPRNGRPWPTARRRARRDSLAEPRGPAAAADAARSSARCARWMMTPGRHRDRAAAGAAVHVVGADAAGAGRGAATPWTISPASSSPSPTSGRTAWAPTRRPAIGTTSPPITLRPAGYSEVRTARTFALVNMAMHDAAVGCWEAKFFYFNPRPSQLDPGLKTALGLPNFPAYTSGHSTFSAAAATVLSYVFPAQAGRARRDEGRGGDLAPVRRHPLPRRHRGGQGPRRRGSAATPSRFARQDGAP